MVHARAVLVFALLAAAAPSAVHAQTLQGRAVDRTTQQPVAGAEVTLVDAQGEAAATTRSEVDGTFRVTGPAAGEYRLTARGPGYPMMVSTVLQLADGEVLLVEARLTPREAEAAAAPQAADRGINGRVAEAGTGRAVGRATVTLMNHHGQLVETVAADAQGGFRVAVPRPGRYQLRANRVGYQPSTSDLITVAPSDTVRVELLVSTDAVVLAPLTVVASSRNVTRNARMAAFEWRQENNPWGRFLGPDRIARIRPFYVTDVLQQVPFVQIAGSGPSRYPTLRGLKGGRCVPAIYVDGHLAGAGVDVNDAVSGDDVAAVEVYDRAFKAPAEFISSNFECGVIVIWTRSPTQNGG